MPLLVIATITTTAGPVTRKSATDAVKPWLEQVLAAEPGHHSSAGHRRSKTWNCNMELSLHSPCSPSPFHDLQWHVIADRGIARHGSEPSSRGTDRGSRERQREHNI